MFPLLFLLLLLDIKQPRIDDDLIKDFPVNEIVDETTTDCSENPSSGGPMGQTLKIELVEPLKPEDVLYTPSAEHHFVQQDTTDIVRPMMVPVKPPQPNPDPQPQKPPIVLTPEPEMLAILSITGVMLLFFLFGRRAGRRFSRRI